VRLGGRRAPRINRDDAHAFPACAAFHALPQDRMTLSHVRADDEEAFRMFDIVVTGGRPITAKGHLVSARRAGHTEAGIGIEIVRADKSFRELIEDVLRFGGELTGM
jgi:hypothetical protein